MSARAPTALADAGPPPRPRRLAGAALLAAIGLALAAVPVRHTWWGGFVLAVAEAGIVGGLADWFAVTALFRRPLGLPIPHTALIPANWERLAQRVGTMVGDRVLTREFVVAEVTRLDLAGLLGRAALGVSRADLEAATRRGLRWAAAEVSPAVLAELAGRLRAALAARPLAPLLARGLEAARQTGWDRRVVAALAGTLAEAAERPEVRGLLARLVDDLLDRYRERLGIYPRVWLGLAGLLGLVDRERLVGALVDGLRQVARDPDHPLRRGLLDALAELPARLRDDPGTRARVEAALAEILAGPAVEALGRDAAAALHRALAADLEAPRSAAVEWIADRLDEARRRVVDDPGLRAELEAWARRHLLAVVERHHGRLAAFVEKGVHALGPAGATRLVEEHAGADLQYIRVNGTVIGGLAGGAIHALHLLLRGG